MKLKIESLKKDKSNLVECEIEIRNAETNVENLGVIGKADSNNEDWNLTNIADNIPVKYNLLIT